MPKGRPPSPERRLLDDLFELGETRSLDDTVTVVSAVVDPERARTFITKRRDRQRRHRGSRGIIDAVDVTSAKKALARKMITNACRLGHYSIDEAANTITRAAS